jgi:uncharacterized protein
MFSRRFDRATPHPRGPRQVRISQPTAKHWLTALRVASLVAPLPPHHANFSKRLRRRPKLHFLDTGLVCYLLGIRNPETLEHHPLRGAIFESYVVGELIKAFEHTGHRGVFGRDKVYPART